ncbi:MAG: hypothetical protein QM758_16680 [Armatimonas sp.]
MNGEDLKAFVDGELPAWKRWWFARKVASDPALQAEVEALKKLSEELASLELPEVSLSESLRTRLLATAPEPTLAVTSPRRSPAKIVAFGLVGASALAVLVVVFVPQAKHSETGGAPVSVAAPEAASKAQEAAKQPSGGAPASNLRNRAFDGGSGTAPAAPAFSRNTYSSMAADRMAAPAENDVSDKKKAVAEESRKYDATLQLKAAKPVTTTFASQSLATAASNTAPGALPEQREVIELVASDESLAGLRKRVEATVKEYGGKVLQQDPLQVTLPQTLRSTARQKLLGIVTVPPRKDGRRLKGNMTLSTVATRLKVTVYFKD